VVGNECCKLLLRRMAPSDAERMSSRIRVRLVSLFGIEIGSRPEQSGAKCHRLLVRSAEIIDVEIEVDLLLATIGPVRRDVVRRELHADPPLAGGVNDAVPVFVLEDSPSKNRGPERTLRVEVCCVEHDDLTHYLHRLDRTE
jgi:hypothetical protein